MSEFLLASANFAFDFRPLVKFILFGLDQLLVECLLAGFNQLLVDLNTIVKFLTPFLDRTVSLAFSRSPSLARPLSLALSRSPCLACPVSLALSCLRFTTSPAHVPLSAGDLSFCKQNHNTAVWVFRCFGFPIVALHNHN